MPELNGNPICGRCRKVYHSNLDDKEYPEGPFHEENREYDYLCHECHAVVVDGHDEDREWLLERLAERDT